MAGIIETVAVVVESGFGVKVFRGETVAEEVDEVAVLVADVAEGVVCVGGYCVA